MYSLRSSMKETIVPRWRVSCGSLCTSFCSIWYAFGVFLADETVYKEVNCTKGASSKLVFRSCRNIYSGPRGSNAADFVANGRLRGNCTIACLFALDTCETFLENVDFLIETKAYASVCDLELVQKG